MYAFLRGVLWFSFSVFLVHSKTNRATAVWSGSSTLLSHDPQQIPEQMDPDTVTTQRHKSASRVLICSFTYVGFIKAAIPWGSDGSMNKWSPHSCTLACVSPLFGLKNTVSALLQGLCLWCDRAIYRWTRKHTVRRTAGWPWTCGCAGIFCYGSAELAVLSLQGAASALHNGWDGSDQIL